MFAPPLCNCYTFVTSPGKYFSGSVFSLLSNSDMIYFHQLAAVQRQHELAERVFVVGLPFIIVGGVGCGVAVLRASRGATAG